VGWGWSWGGGRGEDICRAREDILICVFFTALALAPPVNMVLFAIECIHYTWLHGIVCGCVCDLARTLGTVQTAYSTVPEGKGGREGGRERVCGTDLENSTVQYHAYS
jgi:hypothetical protein